MFHLGAQIAIPYAYINPRDFVQTNVDGTLNLAIAARDAGVERVVHASSSEVSSARFVPITEQQPLEPQAPWTSCRSHHS